MVQSNEVNLIVSAKDLASRTFQKIERNLNKMEQTANKTGKATQGTTASLSAMGAVMGGVTAAFAAMEFGRFALELASFGESIRNTTNRFEDLVGGAQAAEASLARMRSMTRFVAEDAALMSGASDLLLMGVASSTEEAEQIVKLAISLKRSTDSAADAINNFAIMMGNQSYLRLDSFGISAGRTRVRVEELLKTAQAASREEAFAMAVLEIGQETMERTQYSIEQTSTSFSRLTTAAKNATQDIAVFFSTVAEGMSSGFEWGVYSLFGQENAMEAITEQNLKTSIAGLRQMSNEQRGILQAQFYEADRLFRALHQEYMFTGVSAGEGLLNLLGGDQRAWATVTDNYAEFETTLADLFSLLGDSEEAINTIVRAYPTVFSELQKALFPVDRQIEEATRKLEIRSRQMLDNSRHFLSETQLAFEETFAEGFISDQFFDPAALQYLENALEGIDIQLENIARHGAGIVSEDELKALQTTRKEYERMYNEAQRAADAFRNASLSQLMGETGNRSAQEFGSMVSEGLFNPEQSEGFTRALERLTGARTPLTDYVENELTPMVQAVTARFGEQAGAQFAYNMNMAMEQAIRAGLDPASTARILRERLGVMYSQAEAVTVHIPAMATWADVFGPDGIGLIPEFDKEGQAVLDENNRQVYKSVEDSIRRLEAQLNLEYGTIDLNKAILNTLSGQPLTFDQLAAVSPLSPEQLAQTLFNDPYDPSIDMTQDLSVILHSVSFQRALDMTGMTAQELLSQLTEGSDFTYDRATNRISLRPGTYTFVPFGATLSGDADFSLSSSAIREEGRWQTAFDPLQTALNNSRLLATQFENFGQVDLSETKQEITDVNTGITSAYEGLDRITARDWVIPVRFAWDIGSFEAQFSQFMHQVNQDNGGVAPGTRPGGR